MGTKNWTKKDRIACVIIFVVCVITFVTFVSAMTLSYFYDTHTASGIITAGEVDIVAIGGPNNNGQIQFPSVLTPNTRYYVWSDEYKTDGNYNLMYAVMNRSTSGAVFLMVKITSDYYEHIKPDLYIGSNAVENDTYWVMGEGHSNYLFYMTPLAQGAKADLCSAWKVGNITNAIDGSAVTYTISAYAVQVQGGAVDALIASDTDGWQYAPQIFRDMASKYY